MAGNPGFFIADSRIVDQIRDGLSVLVCSDLTDFIGKLSNIRFEYPQLQSSQWIEELTEEKPYGVLWLTPKGKPMTEADWNFADARFLAYVLGPEESDGAPLFIILNGTGHPIDVTMPIANGWTQWMEILNTTADEMRRLDAGSISPSPACSVCAFAGVR